MIIPDYLLEEVKKYCQIRNIPMVNNNIPQKYIRDIQDFIDQRLKKDRQATKRYEEENSLLLKTNINSIMNKIEKFKTMSPIEEYLKEAFIKEDIMKHFKTQFQIGTKTVDFACPLAHLVIECDGKEYHFSDIKQIEKDQERDKYLARRGWRVLHIEGLAIRRNIKLCINKVKEGMRPFIPELAIKP